MNSMKKSNWFRRLAPAGMLALLALVFGLGVTACDNGTGGGGDPTPDPDKLYTITVSPATATSEGDTAAVSAYSAKAGDTVKLEATPGNGRKFVSWSTTGGTLASTTAPVTTLTMPAANVTVTATFSALAADEYTVTTAVTPNNSGTVSANPGWGKKGDSITLTVTPATGWRLASLTPSAGSLAPAVAASTLSYTLTMPASNVTVTAAFEQIAYRISKDSMTGGSVTVSNSAYGTQTITTAHYGESVYLQIEPEDGKVLASLTVTGASGAVNVSDYGNNVYRFTMPAEEVTVAAAFTAPVVVTGTINLKVKGLDNLSSAYLYLYKDSAYNNRVTSQLCSVSSTGSDGDYSTYTVSYSFNLPPVSTSTAYYARLYIFGNGSSSTERELGELFTLTSSDTSSKNAGTKEVTIGVQTISGTLAVTLNGQTPDDYVTLYAYSDANYSNRLDYYGTDRTDGTINWTLIIPDNVSSVYLQVQATSGSYGQEDYVSGYKKLGAKSVSSSPIALGTVAITTRTVSGTLQNAPGGYSYIQILALNARYDTAQALYDGSSTGQAEQYGSGMVDNGAWSMTVPGDVTSAYLYVLLVDEAASTYDCYRSAGEVTFTAGTAVTLDLVTMTHLGVLDLSE